MHADLVRKAKVPELDAWEQFKVLPPAEMGAQSKEMGGTCWASAWREVDGVETAKARLVSTGYQDPHLRRGNVDITGCVSRGSSHLQLALKKGP